MSPGSGLLLEDSTLVDKISIGTLRMIILIMKRLQDSKGIKMLILLCPESELLRSGIVGG